MKTYTVLTILLINTLITSSCVEDHTILLPQEEEYNSFEYGTEEQRVLNSNVFFNPFSTEGHRLLCKLEHMIENDDGRFSSVFLSEFMDSTSKYRVTYLVQDSYLCPRTGIKKFLGDDTLGMKMRLNQNPNEFIILINPMLADKDIDPTMSVLTLFHEAIHVALDVAISKYDNHESGHKTLMDAYSSKFGKTIPEGLYDRDDHHLMVNHFMDDLMLVIADYYAMDNPKIFEGIAYTGLEKETGFAHCYWFQIKLERLIELYRKESVKLIDPCNNS